MQGGLQKPAVVGDAVFFQIAVHPLNIQGQGVLHQRGAAFLRRNVEVFVPVQGGKARGVFLDVVPVVSVLGKLRRVLAVQVLDVPHLKG